MAEQHTLLVFGGSGLLGRHVARWASAQSGWAVHTTYLSNPSKAGIGRTVNECDILDADAVNAVVDKTTPSVIVNAAYRQSGDDALEICSTGAEHIAIASAQQGARLIHVSTDLVFDGTSGRSYSEADPVSPISDYGKAKADAEQRVAGALDDVSIVRTSLIYGEPAAPQEQLVRRALADGDVSFFVDEWRSPVHVRDLAAAIGFLATSSQRGIVHVAGDERVNRLELARLLAIEMGSDASQLRGRTQDPALGPRPQDVSLDCSHSHTLGLRLPGPHELGAQSRSDSS